MLDFLRYHGSHVSAEKAIDFMKYKWISLAVSVLMIATFFGFYFYRYNATGQAFNYGVDFTGGIEILLKFSKPVHGETLVKVLDQKGWSGAITRDFSETEHVIRVKKEATDLAKEAESLRQALEQGLADGTVVEIKRTDSVGSATGSSLWTKSFWAIVISLAAMLLYIAFRFLSFAYAMGAIVSLFHDALAILTVFLILDKEISINVIGAILAVLGYSINDTIVIFARVRENVKMLPHMPMKDIINLSITETLSRTILTTFATLLVVVALFVFGGDTLRDLSLALIIGIVFGIYSTIFIATPVLLFFSKKKTVA